MQGYILSGNVPLKYKCFDLPKYTVLVNTFTEMSKRLNQQGSCNTKFTTRIYSSRMLTFCCNGHLRACQPKGVCLKGCLPKENVCPRGCLPKGEVCLRGVSAQGGVCLGDVCLKGVSAQREGCLPRRCTPPPVDRILDRCL